MVYAYEIIGTDWSLEYGGILDMIDMWWRILTKLIVSRQTFVGKRQFQKGRFVYFILINDNRFEKSVIGNIQDNCCKFVFIGIRICNMVFQTWLVQGI
jgi:hypothetical protein